MFRKILLITSLFLSLPACQVRLFHSGTEASKEPAAGPDGADPLRGKLSEESEGIGGYPLQCYSLAGKADELAIEDHYGCRLIVPSTGRKLNLAEAANSWTWSIVGTTEIGIRDLGDSNSQWHVIFTFPRSDQGDNFHLGARIGFNVQWKNQTEEQQTQHKLAVVLHDDKEAVGGQHIQRIADGILFTISFDEQKAAVRVFARTNGIQDVANDMEELDLGNGSFAYTFSSSNLNYQPGDVIEFRFYAADFQGIQSFLPGPGEDQWFPAFVL